MNLRAKIGAGLLWGLWAPAAVGGGMALAPLQALAALLLAPWGAIRTAVRGHALWLAPIALFFAWAAISQTWSLFPTTMQTVKSAAGALAVLGLCAGLRAAPGPTARGFIWLAVFATALTAAMEIVEAVAGMAINRLFQPDAIDWVLARNPGKGAAVLMLTAPAAAIWLAFGPGANHARRIAAVTLAAACAFVSLQFGMDANRVACAIAFGLAAVAAAAPQTTLRALTAGIAAMLLGAPLIYAGLADRLTGVVMNQSWMHRIDIWGHVTDGIAQKPLFGWGMDATRRISAALSSGIEIPLHAHASSLQIWLELGAVGAVLGAAGIAFGGWRLAASLSRNRLHAACAAALLGAAWTSWTLSFSLWQEWYLGAFGAAAGLVTAITNAKAAPKAELNR
ncbi:MAG: O-antigen ligase family protein [Caulobacterales bacterium]|jgi:O-antigen ligase